MSYALFYSPGAASFAVHWMLIELDVPFSTHLINVESGGNRTLEYLRLNPSGQVPTLVVDGIPVRESTALLMLLAERHPEVALAPRENTPERSEWLEMMIYLANTLLPSMRDWFYSEKDANAEDVKGIRALALTRIENAWERLDKHLADKHGRYLIGDKLSTVDFLATMLMRWTRDMPRPASEWPHLATYIQHMRSLPSFMKTHEREGLTGWVN